MTFLGLHKKRAKNTRSRTDLAASASSLALDAGEGASPDAEVAAKEKQSPESESPLVPDASTKDNGKEANPKTRDQQQKQNVQPDAQLSSSYPQPNDQPKPQQQQQSQQQPQQQQQKQQQYPWSRRSINGATTPFPRYGQSSNKIATKLGQVFIFGGLRGAHPKNDLWVLETDTLSVKQLQKSNDIISPRCGHASELIGNAFLVFGGDNRVNPGDQLDDNLYSLNISTLKWTRVETTGSKPCGRYGHSLNIIGTKVFVFGGQRDDKFFNDIYSFDLSKGHESARWEIVRPAHRVSPAARTNHSMVVFGGKLYLFGGTDGRECFHDAWSFDPAENAWTKLNCVGYFPRPCEGHEAAIVGDLMYIYGGRSTEGRDLNLLSSLRLTSGRWYTFQNMGPAPSPRSGHSMSVAGTRILTLGGQPGEGSADDLTLAYILDTSKIRYPPEPSSQQQPSQSQQQQQPQQQQRSQPTSRPKNQQSTAPMQQRPFLENHARSGSPREIQQPMQPPNESRRQQKRAAIQQPYVRQSPQQGGMVFPLPPYNTTSGGSQEPGAQQQQQQQPMQAQRSERYEQNELARPELRNQRSAQRLRDVDGNEITAPYAAATRDSSADRRAGRPAAAERETAEQYGAATKPPSSSSSASSASSTKRQVIEPTMNVPGAFPVSKNDPEPVVSIRSSPAVQQQARFTPQQPQQEQQRHMSSETMFSHPRRAPTPQSSNGTPTMLPRASFDGRTALGSAESAELERLRRTNRWLESELVVARDAGYKPTAPNDFAFAKDDAAETKKEILFVQAILAMKAELENVRRNVHQQTADASAKLAEAEAARDLALKELEEHSATRSVGMEQDYVSQVQSAEARVRELERQLAAVEAEHAQTSTHLETARRELEDAGLQVEQHREMLDAKHEELLAKHGELQDGQSALEAAETRIRYLESRTADVDAEIKQRQMELESVSQEHADTSSELVSARSHIESLQSDLESSNRHIAALKSQVDELTKQTQMLADVEEIKSAIADSARRAELLQKQLDSMRVAKASAEQRLKVARTELAEYQIRLEEAESRVAELTSQNEELAAEVESSKNATMSRLNKFLNKSAVEA